MTRPSREFLAHGAPLTPELARLHDVATLKVPRQCCEERVTCKLESVYARKLARSHAKAEPWAIAAIVVVFALLGLAVGAFAVAVVL